MIEVYFKIKEGSEAAKLKKLWEDHFALFKAHVQVVRKMIGEMLGIDPDKDNLRVLHDPRQGIYAFISDNFEKAIEEFNYNCGNIFVIKKAQDGQRYFFWEKDPEKSKNDVLTQKLNDEMPKVKHPDQSILWPFFGREAGTVVNGPQGPINGPGIFVDDGKINWIVGNEYTLMDEHFNWLKWMDGVAQCNPKEIIEYLAEEQKKANKKVQEEVYSEVTFAEAKEFRMPFGKYDGRTIDEIAESDEGLKYLVWLYEERKKSKEPETPVDVHLDIYLNEPTIAKDWQ